MFTYFEFLSLCVWATALVDSFSIVRSFLKCISCTTKHENIRFSVFKLIIGQWLEMSEERKKNETKGSRWGIHSFFLVDLQRIHSCSCIVQIHRHILKNEMCNLQRFNLLNTFNCFLIRLPFFLFHFIWKLIIFILNVFVVFSFFLELKFVLIVLSFVRYKKLFSGSNQCAIVLRMGSSHSLCTMSTVKARRRKV